MQREHACLGTEAKQDTDARGIGKSRLRGSGDNAEGDEKNQGRRPANDGFHIYILGRILSPLFAVF